MRIMIWPFLFGVKGPGLDTVGPGVASCPVADASRPVADVLLLGGVDGDGLAVELVPDSLEAVARVDSVKSDGTLAAEIAITISSIPSTASNGDFAKFFMTLPPSVVQPILA
jgi:hypothetical protein